MSERAGNVAGRFLKSVPVLLIVASIALVIFAVTTMNSMIYFFCSPLYAPVANLTSAELIKDHIFKSISNEELAIRDKLNTANGKLTDLSGLRQDSIPYPYRDYMRYFGGSIQDDSFSYSTQTFAGKEEFEQQLMKKLSLPSGRDFDRFDLRDTSWVVILYVDKRLDPIRFNGLYIDLESYKSNLPEIIDLSLRNSVFERYFETDLFALDKIISSRFVVPYFYLEVKVDDESVFQKGMSEIAGKDKYVSFCLPYLEDSEVTIYSKVNYESLVIRGLRRVDIWVVVALAALIIGIVLIGRRRAA